MTWAGITAVSLLPRQRAGSMARRDGPSRHDASGGRLRPLLGSHVAYHRHANQPWDRKRDGAHRLPTGAAARPG
jgi:hypothetical protein